MRAIAVAAVIVYHFAPSVLPAGFLGVDVFFVVSGFLIARLVVAEIAGTGTVSLRHFWARRARRLLPALGTMTVVVLCAVAINSSSTEKHDIRAQALGTLFYCANWVMIYAKGSYFTSVGRPSPFLHMWSLAVEEQFYLVLPLVCFAARRSIVRHPVRAAVVALVGGGRVDGVDGGARVADRRSVARVSRQRLARDGPARRRGARRARRAPAARGRRWPAACGRTRSSPRAAAAVRRRVARRDPRGDARRRRSHVRAVPRRLPRVLLAVRRAWSSSS